MKLSSVDLTLILPCYNEAELFTESVRSIQEVLDVTALTYELLFVDDASSDTTPRLIARQARRDKRIRVIYHAQNHGRGRAVVDGIRSARGRVVGYIDIDCEVSPVYIPFMVSLILRHKADVVIGRRYYRTGPRALIREALSRGYQWISDALIGTGGMDTETGYKFFNRKKIVPIIGKTKHQGWFWDTEIMVYSRRAGLRIKEVPVLFLRRFDKESSVNIVRDTIEYMIQLWRFRRLLR